MKMSLEERIKALEKKVLVLEGGNLIKESIEPMGKEQMVSRPLHNK